MTVEDAISRSLCCAGLDGTDGGEGEGKGAGGGNKVHTLYQGLHLIPVDCHQKPK
jgi:hypothetical protein